MKAKTVWAVLHDVAGPGDYGTGQTICRFADKYQAEAFARVQRCYGQPAEAVADNLSPAQQKRLAVIK